MSMAEKIAAPPKHYWWRPSGQPPEQAKAACSLPPKAGQPCPYCGQATLAYDSLFILTCPHCGYTAEGGAFT
jgi:ribosomal protein L37AE/L43A